MTEGEILETLLSFSDELRQAYDIYQSLRYALSNSNPHMMKCAIYNNEHIMSEFIDTAIKTSKKYFDYFINSTIYKYNNGFVEGLNNKIKVVKRIAFGFRSFYNFRNRILIMQKLVDLKTA